MRRHGLSLGLAQSLVETALETELRDPLLGLNNGGDLKQAVRAAHVLATGRVAAANDDAVGCLLDHFEVVGDQGSNIIGRV